jgi:rifampicin phosphotransferase
LRFDRSLQADPGRSAVTEKTVATKKLATWALAEGGTQERAIEPERQNSPVLTDEQIVRLERLGRRTEGYVELLP